MCHLCSAASDHLISLLTSLRVDHLHPASICTPLQRVSSEPAVKYDNHLMALEPAVTPQTRDEVVTGGLGIPHL